MGLLNRVYQFLRSASGNDQGPSKGEYRCIKCGVEYDRPHERCPECGLGFVAPVDQEA